MAERSTKYIDVFGDPFLDRLVEERDEAILDALWRVREPGLALRLAERLVRVESPRLTDLMLGEVIEPVLGEQVAKELVRILPSAPGLTGKGATRLAERLLDAAPLVGSYESNRALLEVWLVSQPHRIAEVFASSVLRRATPASGNGAVVSAALARAKSSERLHREAAQALLAHLDEDPTPTGWNVASEFVEGTSGAPISPQLTALVRGLLERAPTLCAGKTLPPVLFGLASQVGIPTVKAMYDGGPLAATPGTAAIAHLANSIGRSDSRRVLTALMLVRQPSTHPTLLALADEWDEFEWRSRLTGLLKTNGLSPSLISQLLGKAPTSLTHQVVELAIHVGATAEVISTAASKVAARAAELEETERIEPQALVAIVPWSACRTDLAADALEAAPRRRGGTCRSGPDPGPVARRDRATGSNPRG